MLGESNGKGVSKDMIWDFPYDSVNAIIALLERHGYAMSKKFGQNFLLSASTRRRIVDEMHLEGSESVWEIGPGIGALTTLILSEGVHLTAFEIDHGFCSILRNEAFVGENSFNLVEGDVLKTWVPVYANEGAPQVICGNLPYNVGSICIGRFLEQQCLPRRMVYTLQKEVGERLEANAGSKQWSTLSILAQIDYEVSVAFTIKPGSFFPPPNVDSVVVGLEKRVKPLIPVEQRQVFLRMTSDLFTQRRKTVRNNLLRGKIGAIVGKEAVLDALSDANIVEHERAENLDIPSLARLAEMLQRHQSLHASK